MRDHASRRLLLEGEHALEPQQVRVVNLLLGLLLGKVQVDDQHRARLREESAQTRVCQNAAIEAL
eukprot:4632694-Pleurochrysis_carterae.AAC.1